ncbi:TenA family transcriptional regulator [Fictibacillus macauensis ZFHKF-1]|uniref:Aminopyrimidine aminohydrolase n=1 Tax=Fictibacillus macauensis ZFHKF-1 TaxID=1196324 RepID=I8AIY9_9BACL|nr:thiaminase II [Fictibacillus macauensis]EIT85742.1 TenA family transcriptional regulator [Fictibacillus macauensis ZFHKF-1]
MTLVKKGTFAERLRQSADDVWEAIFAHPFVQGIKDGTLPMERFMYYMKQDYVYLIEYAKLFAIGAVKANDLTTMGWFASHLDGTLNREMDLHRQYCAEIGVSREELEKEQAAPSNLAYTHYMLSAAQQGSIADVMACLLPCAWSYYEIGMRLKEAVGDLEGHPYRAWIEMYSSEGFDVMVEESLQFMNAFADGKNEEELQRLENHFIITSKFEFMFWDMSYYGHEWPV